MSWSHQRRLMTRVLALEAARLVGLASLGRVEGVAEQLAEVDASLTILLEKLTEQGVRYPGQVLGAKYGLSGLEYLVLQLALLPFHEAEACAHIMSLLGEESGARPRLSHVLQLLQPTGDDWRDLQEGLLDGPLLTEGLVGLEEADDGDPALVPHQAVLELFGFEPGEG